MAQAILPTINLRIKFELIALHSIVYLTLEPIDIASLPISPLEKPMPLLSQMVDSGTLVQRIPPASPIELVSARTKVPISNKSAAAIISRFLETDQTIFGFVDVNLFVKGLVERKPQFCSAFLVCSMLYLVCHAYTALDLKSVAVGRLFFREAERIFQAERSSDELVTLAAINIFSLATFIHGNDKIGKELLSSARHMGRRLGLYGQPLDSPSSLAIHILYYYNKSIAIPPSLPIPGNRQYADLWPKYPLPVYIGLSFIRLYQFFTIIQEVAVVYSIADAIPIINYIPIAFTEAKY
ncbi:unnamed protein product [Fusarium fujikuroi]|uniref:Transcription factor domain-containing protein n=1 Tax=Fusarium fujikuroi TaxID=5127 RepID=A0A9Q9RRW7_FUSFU|nr:unnamed protein product [Fusarium fujikuroi]